MTWLFTCLAVSLTLNFKLTFRCLFCVFLFHGLTSRFLFVWCVEVFDDCLTVECDRSIKNTQGSAAVHAVDVLGVCPISSFNPWPVIDWASILYHSLPTFQVSNSCYCGFGTWRNMWRKRIVKAFLLLVLANLIARPPALKCHLCDE